MGRRFAAAVRGRSTARNTGGGRCLFSHFYLDSVDDLRRQWQPDPCVQRLKKKLFYVIGLKPIRNGNGLSIVRLFKGWNLKLSCIHIGIHYTIFLKELKA